LQKTTDIQIETTKQEKMIDQRDSPSIHLPDTAEKGGNANSKLNCRQLDPLDATKTSCKNPDVEKSSQNETSSDRVRLSLSSMEIEQTFRQ
jgi:hypothetical protein